MNPISTTVCQSTFTRQVLLATALTVMAVPGVSYAQGALVLDDVGNVGIGLESPERQLHLRGSNAVFRMDRTTNTAAFLMTRIDASGNPMKTFVLGTNASDFGNGEFVINDLGTAVTGGGTTRLKIDNNGTVSVGALVQTSSARYKRDITTLTGTGEALQQLRGVRYVRLATGRTELGLIAEEVAAVYPEVVERDATTGQVEAINYSALTAVLVEALKEQQANMATYQTRTVALETQVREQQAEMAAAQIRTAAMEEQLAEMQSLKTRLVAMERRMEEADHQLPVTLTQR